MNPIKHALGTALALIVIAGCSGAEPPELQGAVYSDQIPVYASAEVRTSMGGTSSGLDGSDAIHSLSWWLETQDSMHDVESWYDAQLPNAEKIEEDWGGDGVVKVYTWAPSGGKPGEEFSIVLSTTDIQITESVSGHR